MPHTAPTPPQSPGPGADLDSLIELGLADPQPTPETPPAPDASTEPTADPTPA
jgi:hypothetical protein